MYTNFCPSNTIRSVERYGSTLSSTPCPGKGSYNSNSGKCETPPKESACQSSSACTFSSASGFSLVVSQENKNAMVCQKDPVMVETSTVSIGSPVSAGSPKKP